MGIETDAKTALRISKEAWVNEFKDEIKADPEFIVKSKEQIQKFAVAIFIAIQNTHEETGRYVEPKPSKLRLEAKKVLLTRKDDIDSTPKTEKQVDIPPLEMLEVLLEGISENDGYYKFLTDLEKWYSRKGFFTEKQMYAIEQRYLKREKQGEE